MVTCSFSTGTSTFIVLDIPCPDQTIKLTCNITGGTILDWLYINSQGITQTFAHVTSLGEVTPANSVVVNGVAFMITILFPTSPFLVSQISFNASQQFDGDFVMCSGAGSQRTNPISLRNIG